MKILVDAFPSGHDPEIQRVGNRDLDTISKDRAHDKNGDPLLHIEPPPIDDCESDGHCKWPNHECVVEQRISLEQHQRCSWRASVKSRS